jgi:tetratricopeptide (TPR) repeat protein
MSKKQRRGAPRGAPRPTQLPPEALDRKAREDLTAGRHREAIAAFKQLLKLEPRPDWRAALADAYAGRARDLAAKGMLKEALVMWENRAGLGEGVAFDPDHARLLLRLDQVEPVLALLADEGAVPAAERDRLRPLLAARCLAGDAVIAARLPADDPLIAHGEAARSALAAYCAGDDAALQTALAAIPFRSPYRDAVQILKALQRLPERPAEAAGLLARVGDDSAFARLKRAAELALVPEADFAEAVRGKGKATVRFACALRGWPDARIALLDELDRLGPTPRPEALLRLMQRNAQALGADWVRRRGLRLLIRDFPASLTWLKAMGARPASREETELVAAWSADERKDLWDQQERWEEYVGHLIAALNKATSQDPDQRLRIALALRRCDSAAEVLADADPSDDPEDLDRLLAEQLEQSLSWDPDDRDTYLRLIGYYRRAKRLKDVRRLLDAAADRWPKDMQVLGAALDTALDAGSFKKATGIARRMLELDPINSGVRERLAESHLAHARKQFPKGRPDLARKELASAREWARTAHTREQIALTEGLAGLLETGEQAVPALRDLLDRLGGGLAILVAFALAGEAGRLSSPKLMKMLGLGQPAAPARDDLLATLARLRSHLDGGGRISRDVDGLLGKALPKAAWASLSRSETESACDTLRRCGLHPIRLRVARAALKRWHGAPLFELHAFEAKYPKGFFRCSDDDFARLETALERAREQGDTRIVLRIEEILADLDPFGMGPMPIAPPRGTAPVPFEGKEVEVITALIRTLGLDGALKALQLPASMKRDLKDLERDFGADAVAETLVSFLKMMGDATGAGGLPMPQPSPRGRGAPKAKVPKPRSADEPDDPFPDQLDLFS